MEKLNYQSPDFQVLKIASEQGFATSDVKLYNFGAPDMEYGNDF